MEMAFQIEEKRKEDFLDRQAHCESIRAEHLRRQEEDRRLHRQEVEFMEQRRQVILMQQRKEEERKAEDLLEKFKLDEIHVQREQRRRSYDHSLVKEKSDLKKLMKLENVDRVMRVNEYRRLNTLKKIEDSEKRIHDMISNRDKLKEDRKRAAAAARMQKEGIMKVMDDIRTNATKANKIINKCMSTKGKTISQVIKSISPNKKSTSAHRSRAGKGGGFGDTGRKTTAEVLGLRQSAEHPNSGTARPTSAAEAPESPDGNYNDTLNQQGKANAVYSASSSGEPKPYVSPYVLPVVQKPDEGAM
jgi:hypothetical protein